MKKTWFVLMMTAVFCFSLAACGSKNELVPNEAEDSAETVNQLEEDVGEAAGNEETNDQNEADGAETEAVSEEFGSGTADELKTLLESSYGFKYIETAEGNEGESIYREELCREDGSKEHWVNISFKTETNQITAVDWFFAVASSDIDYWMEAVGLTLDNQEDLDAIRDILTAEEGLPGYESMELSNSLCAVTVTKDGNGDEVLGVLVSKK